MRRVRGFAISVAASLAVLPIGQATACVPLPPPIREPGESDEAFQARIKPIEISPEQRELNDQAVSWGGYEMVFLARVEKIRFEGKVYPQPKKRTPKRKAGKVPPPEILQPLIIPYGTGHEAYIRPLRWLKGPQTVTPDWHSVGSINTCGSASDGALGHIYPDDEVIVFANWQPQFRYVGGKVVESRYLSLYGTEPDKIVEPRIKTALAAEAKAESQN